MMMCLCVFEQLAMAQEENPYIEPQAYMCNHIDTSLMLIDGLSAENAWKDAAWSRSFVDIEGVHMTAPYHNTKVKMIWDDVNLYVFAQMSEDHLVATLKNHDDIIYRDNDFEIFVDLDGDTHNYCEIEVNLYNSVLDLFMAAPYRNGGPLVMDWTCRGLETAVSYQGTLNDPSDIDEGWAVEMAIPWTSFSMHYKPNLPSAGDFVHVNFSRVQWGYDVVDGAYVKRKDAEGKQLPEHNWVWSEQGKINMHMPEMWGHVFLSPDSDAVMPEMEGEQERWILRQMYYAQRSARSETGYFISSIDEFGTEPWNTEMAGTLGMSIGHDSYEMYLNTGKVIYLIDERGHTWTKDVEWKKEDSSK